MSYPQPDADKYCVNGYSYFRLNTPIASPGDIYESKQSGHAFAIGPESDIANVTINYFDDQVPTFVQQTTISTRRSFTGEVYARNGDKYSPSGVPGRILLWPADIYDPNFKPKAFVNGDQMSFITPQLDVIQYFEPQGSLVPQRIDKQYLYQNYTASGTDFIVVPFYGRKFCFAQITNRTPASSLTFSIIGVNYAITDDSVIANQYHQETVLLASASYANGTGISKVITDTANGTFDALVFAVHINGPAILQITTSDNAT